MKKILFILFFLSCFTCLMAEDTAPHPSFTWVVQNGQGEIIEDVGSSYEGSAPITATMTAHVVYENEEGEEIEYPNATFYGSWRVWSEGGQMENPEISNPSNPTDFFFRSAGTDSIAYVGYVTIDYDTHSETIQITPEYIREYKHFFTVKTYESKLAFPNAFSPNGDNYNEKFKAKEVQSIIEFHAAIYNRWGQKLYEWDDVNDGWDGKFNGRPVKDGVYYIQVKAKGSDGQQFVIKKDVNLMRGFEENTTTTN